MATYKVLGQSNPTSGVNADIYTAPAGKQAVCSTLVVANQAGTGTAFRIAVRPAGAAINQQHYIAYDTPIAANDSIFLTLGITLNETDVVTVLSGSGAVSFNLFGSEI
jgi:hypothetical protein